MSERHRVLVTGSRTWVHARVITALLDSLHEQYGDRLTIVHGACPRGADAIADAWCRRHSVGAERYPADWTEGRGAGHLRNAAMVATRPAECFAFIRNESPGATGCANRAESAGIPTTRYQDPSAKAERVAPVAPAARPDDTDPMGTIPLFELPDPEQLQPATLPGRAAAAASVHWRTYSGKRIPCDECIRYLHEHDGRGPQPRSVRRVRTVGKQQWRLCEAHAEPREKADKEAAERRKTGVA